MVALFALGLMNLGRPALLAAAVLAGNPLPHPAALRRVLAPAALAVWVAA
jgi:hypothetical protein